MELEEVNGRMKPTIAELQKLQRGQWIFTCAMEPKQFDCFDKEKDPKHYSREKFTDKEWERFSKYDDFTTIGGSHHSVFHCGLKTISEEYAKFFIENKCSEMFPNDGTAEQWDEFENKVKEMCKLNNIEYEGI